MTDLDIARSFKPFPIQEIGKRLGLSPDELFPYGRNTGKVSLTSLERMKRKPQGRYETIATRMYGAGAVFYDKAAEQQIDLVQHLGYGQLPICMAKTPLSLSHDPVLKGRPTGFTLPIKELRLLAGAGFLTTVCSGIQLMPGLPKKPAGERIDIDRRTAEIVGLS